MRWLALILMFLPGLALAQQDLMATLPGSYGSASDPAGSCATNPHRLSFLTRPPHLMLTWPAPWTDAGGNTRFSRRYDLLAVGSDTLTLRWEADPERLGNGRRPIWILRRTTNPEGYCWGREDWPAVRCEDQQLRCDTPTS